MTEVEKDTSPQEAAIGNLRRLFEVNTIVYTSLTHVSASGMSRGIKVLIPVADVRSGLLQIEDISWLVARALGRKLHPKGGVKEHGAGMDMGWHLVHSLAGCLYGWQDRAPYRLEQRGI